MFKSLSLFSAAVAAALIFSSPAFAEKRVAILIGNSNYVTEPLSNPRNDAGRLAATFTELGFETTLYLDVQKAQLPLLRESIETELAAADVGVLFFAGHGLQYQGENLLVSVDADLTSVQGVTSGSITLSDMLTSATEDNTGMTIVILDACRNPLVPDNSQGLKPGFSFEEAPRGEVLIAFSTGAGELAFDSTGGSNSPYTTALVNALEQSDRDVYDTFRSVRGSVRAATGGRQIPWITGSIETDYVFRPTQSTAFDQSSNEGPSVDEVLWSFLRTSIDPADPQRFLDTFPNSRFAEEAREVLNLQMAQVDLPSLSRNGVQLSPQDIQEQIAGDPSVQPEGDGRKEPILDQSGSYILRDSYRIWPLELPQTTLGLSSLASSCDEEAADPVDPNKLSPGVSVGVMDIRRALRACAYDLAADPENPRLMFQFARTLDQARRFDWANDYYDRAITHGYSAAMVNRGFNARMGRGGPRDPELSATLYRRAALLGNPRARTNLGGAYLSGRGVERNPQEGILWLRLAASMGWPHATNALGDAYWNGRGLEQDRQEAVELYRSASEQGQSTGMANLGRAYLLGQGVTLDTQLGLDLLDRSMAVGNGFAALHAGRFYLRGNADVAADPTLAKTMFEAATRRGARAGYLELARGYERGTFVEGVNLELALRNALYAKRARLGRADEVIESLQAKMEQAAIDRITRNVNQEIALNGL